VNIELHEPRENSGRHTPGPWHLIRSGMRDNSAVATLEPKPETMEVPNYWLVAQANTLRDEWAANARLIAAAPELLAALERIVKNPEAQIGGHIRAEAVAAIRKATGVSA